MEWVLLPILAAVVSSITAVSGFGLGTVLLPAFAFVLPLPVAIGATAVVHLASGLTRLTALRDSVNWAVALRFGLPALIAAPIGAAAMLGLAEGEPLWEGSAGPLALRVTVLRLAVALLLVGLAAMELRPRREGLPIRTGLLPLGGAASGLVGGFCGLQGALRAPFLLRAGLDTRQFAATSATIAVAVDCSRLAAYGVGALAAVGISDAHPAWDRAQVTLVALACAGALGGSLVGTRILGRVTRTWLRRLVAALLLLSALALALGIASPAPIRGSV